MIRRRWSAQMSDMSRDACLPLAIPEIFSVTKSSSGKWCIIQKWYVLGLASGRVACTDM